MTATLEARVGAHIIDIISAAPGVERGQAVWRAKRLERDLRKAYYAGCALSGRLLKDLNIAALGFTRADLERVA